MSEELKHIFDKSACLSKRQMKEYLAGTMTREECHALEHHITNCELCSEALEGMLAHKEEAIEAMDELNNTFIKEHFLAITPQQHNHHTNTNEQNPSGRKNYIAFYRTAGIAAALLIGFGAMWYFDLLTATHKDNSLARVETTQETDAGAIRDTNKDTKQEHTEGVIDNSLAVIPPPQRKADGVAVSPVTEQTVDQPPVALEGKGEDDTQKETVVNYKTPLVRKEEPGSATSAGADKIEKLPARSTSDVATLSNGTYQQKEGDKRPVSTARTNSTIYAAEGVQAESARNKEKAANEEADQLYGSAKYSKALNGYKKQMDSKDKDIRQHATLMAARCYLGLEQKESAKKLLQQLVDEGSGPEKRQARRLLRSLEE